ncbi:plasma membrane calcium-transporting ATPase 1 [Cyclospora cayetanensis]|uniref:Plasma membrane calcium-transporting ATPase 1 n=1 Tax=Cyclospora cayetanensis TaxID=88456 RepID=A0A6P6RS36_9EIME|nr:plasma membrane calcium-transporting ATPase 1 [Cyclospora cayetanensis]
MQEQVSGIGPTENGPAVSQVNGIFDAEEAFEDALPHSEVPFSAAGVPSSLAVSHGPPPEPSGDSTGVSPAIATRSAVAAPTDAEVAADPCTSSGCKGSFRFLNSKLRGEEEGVPVGPPGGATAENGNIFGITPEQLTAKAGAASAWVALIMFLLVVFLAGVANDSAAQLSLRVDLWIVPFLLIAAELVTLYVSRTQYEELVALQELGGVAGLARALRTDLRMGLPSTGATHHAVNHGKTAKKMHGEGLLVASVGESIGLEEGADLSQADAAVLAERKRDFGENVLPHRPPTPFWRHCWDAASDFTLRVLMVAGFVMIVLGVTMGEHPEVEWVEGFAIWVAVMVVVSVTALNDWGKEKQFRKLSKLREEKRCRVVRGGEEVEVSVFCLLVGDLLRLEVGDEVPADALVVQCVELKADESAMTGESESITKQAEAECWKQHHLVASPLLVAGSTIVAGSCSALVIAVGKRSQQGQLFQTLTIVDAQPTPLQNKLNALARDIGRLGFLAACVTFFVLLIQFWIMFGLTPEGERPTTANTGKEHLEFLVVAITIVVVAVPEGLPLAVTISLAYSVGRMLKDKNYVRRLAACETMGGANEICSDKTGTLTKNKMEVQAVWRGGGPAVSSGYAGFPGPFDSLTALGSTPSLGGSHNEPLKATLEAVRWRDSVLTATASRGDTAWDAMIQQAAVPTDGGRPRCLHCCTSELEAAANATLGAGDNTKKAMRDVPLEKGLTHREWAHLLSTAIILNSTGSLAVSTVDAAPHVGSKKGLVARCFRHTPSTSIAAETTSEFPDAEVGGKGPKHVGSPTECALLELAAELGYGAEDIRKQQLLVYGDPIFRAPFTSDRKIMTTIISLHPQQQQQQQHTVLVAPPSVSVESKGKNRRDSRSSRRSSSSSTNSRLGSTTTASTRLRAPARGPTEAEVESLSLPKTAKGEASTSEETENEIQMYRVYVKGAAETVLRLCSHFIASPLLTGKLTPTASASSSSSEQLLPPDLCALPLTSETAATVERKVIDLMAGQALRTICIAYKDFVTPKSDSRWKEMSSKPPFKHVETGLTCLAILGIRDPLREEVPAAVRACQAAGIRVRMVTGDNLETAKQIAIKCNIFHPEEDGLAMTGAEFTRLVGGVVCSVCLTRTCDCPTNTTGERREGRKLRKDVVKDLEAFRRIAPRLEVLGRSQPLDKFALVVGLQQLGAVVAVTGDGANDAPALKTADVGFAMGITGKEVAKQAADIVLLDDNFESLVSAVKWGRSIYTNIQRFLEFQLTVNVVAVATALVCAVTLRESPLSAVQMLWVNLIMDSFASLALATEPPSDELLRRKPHTKQEYLVTKVMFRNIIGQALYQLVVMFTLIFAGEKFIPEETWAHISDETRRQFPDFCEFSDCWTAKPHLMRSGRRFVPFSSVEDYKGSWRVTIGPSRHYTVVFNAFVLMQLGNMFNARRSGSSLNLCKGVLRSKMFLGIALFIAGFQAFVVELGGLPMSCTFGGITGVQWLICGACGLGSVVVGALLLLVPYRHLPETGKREVNLLQENRSIALASRGRLSTDRLTNRIGCRLIANVAAFEFCLGNFADGRGSASPRGAHKPHGLGSRTRSRAKSRRFTILKGPLIDATSTSYTTSPHVARAKQEPHSRIVKCVKICLIGGLSGAADTP